MNNAKQWIIIRRIADDELVIVGVDLSKRKRADSDPQYTFAGPFATKREAQAKLAAKDESVRRQLYPEQ